MRQETVPGDSPSPSLEERFLALAHSKSEDAANQAAELLQNVLGQVLERKLSSLALSLGGGDEAAHLSNWAICTAVTKARTFDPNRSSLSNWIFWIGRNRALSLRRKMRPDPGLERDLETQARTVESRIQNKDAFQRVWKRLPADIHRQVLFLDLKHAGQAPGGLARELGLDRATFYKRRCEARRLFRELWQDEFGDPDVSFYGELE